MIFHLNLYRLNLLKILVISVLYKYFAFNGRVDILCRVSVSKIYARVNNKNFIERYICYAGFTLYTSNMYTCKYVYFRKDIFEGHTITCIIQPNRWWKNNFLILMVLMSGYIVLGTSIGVGTKRYGHELTVAS